MTDIDLEKLASTITDDLFEIGREPDHEVYRIQFMAGRLGEEKGCGGLDKRAVERWLTGALGRYIPRPPKKAQEVEWVDGLPPVGCECEFIYPGIRSHGWQTGVIKTYFDDRVVIQSNPLIWEPNGIAVILIDSELKFRPLKSKQERQREELISAASEVIESKVGINTHVDISFALRMAIEALLDAGMLKEPKP